LKSPVLQSDLNRFEDEFSAYSLSWGHDVISTSSSNGTGEGAPLFYTFVPWGNLRGRLPLVPSMKRKTERLGVVEFVACGNLRGCKPKAEGRFEPAFQIDKPKAAH
jgi:hypothetical protein